MHIFARAVLCMMGTISIIISSSFSPNSLAQTHSSQLSFPVLLTNDQASSIRETVQIAVANHPKIQAAFKAYRAQYSRLTQIESAFLPKLTLGLGIGREDSNNTSTRAITGSGSKALQRRESSIALNQMLFDGFKTHWQRKSQLEEINAAEVSLQNLMSETALKAIDSYLEVAKANKILSFNITNLQAHQAIARDIRVRVRSGKDDYAKVSQVNARLSLSLANVEASKNNVLKAGASFRREVGQNPGKSIQFQDKLFKLPNNQSELLDEVLRSNLLIMSEIKKKQSTLAIAKAANNTDYPSLFLESGATWNENIDGIDGRNSDAFLMLRMRYDLFKGGADKAEKKYASLINQQARYDLDDARRLIRRDAEQAWFNYQSGSNRVGYLQDYVEFSENTQKAYKKQFSIGQRTLIDLLDAENELLRAKRLLVESQKDLYLSKYQILNLTGKLLAVLSVDVLSVDVLSADGFLTDEVSTDVETDNVSGGLNGK